MHGTTHPEAPARELHYSGFRYFGRDGEIRPVLLARDREKGLWYADLWANALTRPWLRRLWFTLLADADLLFREIEPSDLHYLVRNLGLAESAFESWRDLDWKELDPDLLRTRPSRDPDPETALEVTA